MRKREEEALAALVKKAELAWPSISVPREKFAEHVLARLAEGNDRIEALSRTHAVDLYLACACASGNAEAFRCLEEGYFPSLRRTLERVDPSGLEVEDTLQCVRDLCFVPRADGKPAIATYSGRGTLAAWLRLSGLRLLRRRLGQRATGAISADQSILDRLVEAGDPEILFVEKHYREQLHDCFRAAMKALPRRERRMLRFRYGDGLGVEEIGRLFGLHKSSISRALGKACSMLLSEFQQRLYERLSLDAPALDSLLRQIPQILDASFPSSSSEPTAEGS